MSGGEEKKAAGKRDEDMCRRVNEWRRGKESCQEERRGNV